MSKNTLNTLGIVVTHIVIFTGFFVWDYFDNNLTINELPYIIAFYLTIVIFFFAITNIAYNLSCNNENVLHKKYQIYRQFEILDKENNLDSFENFCITQNNINLLEEMSLELTTSESENLNNLIKTNDYECVEKHLLELSTKKNKKFNKFLENFNKPLYCQYFYEYKNNSLLTKKTSIFGFIFGFISFIITIIPFFINNVPEISLVVYLDFADPLWLVITNFLTIYKTNVNTISKEYNSDLQELKIKIKRFNTKE